MGVLVVSTLCRPNSRPWVAPMGVMAVVAGISSCVGIRTSGPYYTFVIIKTYWQKMERRGAVTTVPVVVARILSLMYHWARLPGMEKRKNYRPKYWKMA